MAFDAARGLMVLFGPDEELLNTETWEWDGVTWTLRSSLSGPSVRRYHAMAYDSRRNVTVLFGGKDFTWNGETWEWDGNVWMLRSTSGPAPRYFHAMSYDVHRGVTVLFGGYTRGPDFENGETWEWDGDQWFLRATTGPSPRYQHALVYDTDRKATVLFGGKSRYLENDTWEWNGHDWVLRDIEGPSRRRGHGMAFDQARGVAVLFGGYVGGSEDEASDETWEYAGSCSGRERIKRVVCRANSESLQLKVILADGLGGDDFRVSLDDGSSAEGVLDSYGKARVKFNNRPAGDSGVAIATWSCGAAGEHDFQCP